MTEATPIQADPVVRAKYKLPRLIGFSGYAQVGKTTAAGFVAERLPDVQIIPFAGKLKQIARDMGWDGEKDEKGRRLLQVLGTECGRDCIADDIWVRHWLTAAQVRMGCTVIADDVRFQNEVDCIRDHGGMVIRITRPGHGPSDHASEQADFPCDFTINNNGTEAELRDKIHALLSRDTL